MNPAFTDSPFGPTDPEGLLKAAHSSLSIRFGTTAPFAFGKVGAQKVGYACIPMVVISVTCRDEDLPAMVPIARQRVYGELAERGWSADDIGFRPSSLRGRRRKFRDENESSESCGRDRMGVQYELRFEMGRPLAAAAFRTGSSSWSGIPDRRARS